MPLVKPPPHFLDLLAPPVRVSAGVHQIVCSVGLQTSGEFREILVSGRGRTAGGVGRGGAVVNALGGPYRVHEEGFEILGLGTQLGGPGDLPFEDFVDGIHVVEVWTLGEEQLSPPGEKTLEESASVRRGGRVNGPGRQHSKENTIHKLFACLRGPSLGSGCSPRTGACGRERGHVREAGGALLKSAAGRAGLPGVAGGLLVQQQLLLLLGELQVQLEGVVVQVVDVLLDVAAGPLRRRGLVRRQRVRGAGLGHLHVAELAQEVVVLGESGPVSTHTTPEST